MSLTDEAELKDWRISDSDEEFDEIEFRDRKLGDGTYFSEKIVAMMSDSSYTALKGFY